MPLQLTTFKIPELVDEVMSELEPIIKRSKLTVTRELPRTLPPLTSDRQKVKQIVLNLLSNALKFTPPGLGHDRRARTTRRDGRSTIAVTDTGIGIAADDQDEDLRGLPPARQLADARLRRHRPRACRSAGGWRRCSTARIELESEVGQGLDVHADAAGARRRDDDQHEDRTPAACCVVEDYQDAREMYAEYLQFSGFDVVEAANGIEALAEGARRCCPTSS